MSAQQRARGAARVTQITGNPRTGEYVMKILELMLGQIIPVHSPDFPRRLAELLEEAGPVAATIAVDSYNRVLNNLNS
jgi:hypothetical protein